MQTLRSRRNSNKSILTEAQVRKIIAEEVELYLINEGMWDSVKAGISKIVQYVTKQFKSAAADWAKTIKEKLSSIKIPDEAKKILQVLKKAMADTGASFELDDTLKAAKQLGAMGTEGILNSVEEDLEGPVMQKAEQANTKAEGKYLTGLYVVLAEHKFLEETTPRRQLKEEVEEFGITSILGAGLAVMGGLPLLFKGLHHLAKALGATKTAKIMHTAEHVCHAFESKVINFVMPDILAYGVYQGLWNIGIKLTTGEKLLTRKELKASKEGKPVLEKAKSLIYKVLLIYFAINGLMGVLKAGASLLGFVEGSATTVKGVELARGAMEISKLVRSGGIVGGTISAIKTV
jgi:hypothetical protein